MALVTAIALFNETIVPSFPLKGLIPTRKKSTVPTVEESLPVINCETINERLPKIILLTRTIV